MLGLLNFFGGSAARLQALLIGALVAVLVCAGLLVWGLYWRGEFREAKASIVAFEAQGKILAESVRSCSASVEQGKVLGEQAKKDTRGLLEVAKRLAAGGEQRAGVLEELLKKPPPPGAGCEDAWKEIQKARGAQ
mgnify:CR=1 FL=1